MLGAGAWFVVSSCLWCTRASLNSSTVRVFRSFWRKVMSKNMVAKVRPTSVAVFVLFWGWGMGGITSANHHQPTTRFRSGQAKERPLHLNNLKSISFPSERNYNFPAISGEVRA